MDFYLARNDSLRLLRWARREKGVALLIPAEAGANAGSLEIDRPSRADLLRLRDVLPEQVAEPMRKGRISLHSGSREGKSQSALARVTPGAVPLGTDAFLEVALADGDRPWDCDGWHPRVFVEGPALALASCGMDLERRVRADQMSREAAVLRASAFAMELAGTYCRDPADPVRGEIAYGLEAVGGVAQMGEWLRAPRRLHGIDLARIACAYAADGAASAMETFWYHAFCMPPRLGGMHLARPQLNAELPWPDGLRGMVCHKSMRPDFLWGANGVACEYDGATHREEDSFAEDRRRQRDYALCEISFMALTSADSESLGSMKRALGQIAVLLGRSEPDAFARRVRRNLASDVADVGRKILMSQLLPASARDVAEDDVTAESA